MTENPGKSTTARPNCFACWSPELRRGQKELGQIAQRHAGGNLLGQERPANVVGGVAQEQAVAVVDVPLGGRQGGPRGPRVGGRGAERTQPGRAALSGP